MNLNLLKKHAIKLLIKLINTPSISGNENKVSNIVINYLKDHGIQNIQRKYNNIWVYSNNYQYDYNKIILLNSHYDTVNPGTFWKSNPFYTKIINDKIIGLGSNDAGASVVSLITVFLFLNQLPNLPYKLLLAITAEEEISGKYGIKSILSDIGKVDLGIIGEPTKMHLAIYEKGLIVLDCFAYGKTGHVAINNRYHNNAIYNAIVDIQNILNFKFDKISNILGPVKITISQINAGIQHNIIPDICHFVIDIRTNEKYTNKEIINIIDKMTKSKIKSRSDTLNSSSININHPIVKKAISLNIPIFGSKTLSDQSLMNFNTVKIGPGDSNRSHSPNEYILISEIYQGIDIYINLLKNFNF